MKISYSGFKSTNEIQTKLNSISVDDIKSIDGITPDINVYPSEVPAPNFSGNPYTFRGLDDVTVTYVKDSIKPDPRLKTRPDLDLEGSSDWSGELVYKVDISVPNLEKKQLKIEYKKSYANNHKQVFRMSYVADGLLGSIPISRIKLLDGITANKNVFPSTISEPQFNSNPYTFNNLQKFWSRNSLSNVTIRYVKGSMKKLDSSGRIFYKVKLSHPGTYERTRIIAYPESFKSYTSHKTFHAGVGSISKVSFSSDGTKILASGSNGIKIWNATGSIC